MWQSRQANLNFVKLSFRICVSCVYYCDDLLCTLFIDLLPPQLILQTANCGSFFSPFSHYHRFRSLHQKSLKPAETAPLVTTNRWKLPLFEPALHALEGPRQQWNTLKTAMTTLTIRKMMTLKTGRFLIAILTKSRERDTSVFGFDETEAYCLRYVWFWI